MSNVGPQDHTKRLVPFLATLLYAKAPFSLLNRYYIFNCVTGAHSLFVFGQNACLNRGSFFKLKKK